MAYTRHGLTVGRAIPPEYRAWINIKQRCFNTKDPHYKHYGGRGIGMCKRWRESFLDFRADVGERPSAAYSLDRFPDNNGDYEPGNVRWANRKQQMRNTRDNVRVTIGTQSFCLIELEEVYGVSRHAIRGRLRRGWSIARALNLSSTADPK